MKKYNKENGRKNMRLQGYDYSRAGLYFLTIVVQNRLHLFGQVQNQKMILNDAGRMIEKWYYEIENKYPDKRCREMVVMPNHFHCIIENMEMTDIHENENENGNDNDNDNNNDNDNDNDDWDAHVGAPLRGRPDYPINPNRPINPDYSNTNDPKYGMDNKKHGSTIGDVMNWFKTMTTNEYIRGVNINNWQRCDRKLWQRNYYDHIIRDSGSDKRITIYIIKNPEKWDMDKFNGKN